MIERFNRYSRFMKEVEEIEKVFFYLGKVLKKHNSMIVLSHVKFFGGLIDFMMFITHKKRERKS